MPCCYMGHSREFNRTPNNIKDSQTANQENQTEIAILIPSFKDASNSNLEMFSIGYSPNLEAVGNLLEL